MDIGKLSGRIELDNRDFKNKLTTTRKDLGKFGESTKKLNVSMASIATTSFKVAGALTAMAAAASAAFSQFDKGARLMDQRRVFSGLAANIGRDADEMIRELKDATKGVVSEVNAMATASQAIVSGMQFDHVVTALEYLQRYAKATGKSFQQLTSTIMTGMARGSVLMLDDAGIILDQASLVADAEKKLGHALNEVEKKQLLVNAAIEQMQRKLPALGGSVTTVADKLQAMRTSLTDFKASMELKAFTVGMSGLKWLSERFYDLVLVMADVRIGAEIMKNSFVADVGDMVAAINNKLMSAIIGLRNALSHSLAGLWDQDNPIANSMKTALSASVKALDGGLNVLFETNKAFLDAEKGQNADLARLYKAREELVKDQARLMQTFTIPEGRSTKPGTFDLSGTATSSAPGKDKAAGKTSSLPAALSTLQDQITRVSFDKVNVGVSGLELAMREAVFETERLREQYGALAGDNPQINIMIDQIRQLKQETALATDQFEKSQAKIQLMGDVLGDTLRNFTQPLADSLADLAKTGKASLKDLASSLTETLQVYAAEKTSHFLLEASYRSIMAMVDSYNRAKWMAEAATALKGAAVMGSFVAGSGLAGMAHDGISNIPDDGTWLLKKNERVVDANTNADLKEFIKNGGSRGDVNMTVNINGGDENSVRKALPEFKEAVVDVVSESYASGGRVYQTIQNYR